MPEREALARLLWAVGALELGEGEAPLRFAGEAALGDAGARDALLEALETLVRDHYAAADCLLGGPWAAALAERLGLPLNPEELPERPLFIEETVAGGEDLLAAAVPLREEGKSVAAAAIFNLGLDSARRLLDKADVRLHWLTDLETAAAVALQEGLADFETYDRLLALTEE